MIFSELWDDPVSSQLTIKDLVADGYIVRTRADGGTAEARTGETVKRDMAFSSTAQIISTDYYRADWRFIVNPQNWTDYDVQWPGGHTARSNVDFDCYVD